MVFEADSIDWQGSAGQLLDRLARALPAAPRLEINVFGSTPLQLFIERGFVSEDVDLFSLEEFTPYLEKFVEQQHWGKGQTDLCIQDFDPTLKTRLANLRPPTEK